MFVRNLLSTFPFIAIFAACGAGYIGDQLSRRIKFRGRLPLQVALTSLLILLWGINSLWLVQSANAIADPHPTNQIEQLAHYIDQHGSTRFYLTQDVAHNLAAYGRKTYANITQVQDEADEVVFYGRELATALAAINQTVPINRFSYFTYLPPFPSAPNPNYFYIDENSILILDGYKFKDLKVTLK